MQNDILTIWLAILALFTIDFSINAGAPLVPLVLSSPTHLPHIVQAVDRALIVDTLPSSDQADANAWAARMLGVGSVAGYFMFVHFILCFSRALRAECLAVATST